MALTTKPKSTPNIPTFPPSASTVSPLSHRSDVAQALAAFSRLEQARAETARIKSVNDPKLMVFSAAFSDRASREECVRFEAEVHRSMDTEVEAERRCVAAIRRATHQDTTTSCALTLPDGRLVIVLADIPLNDGGPIPDLPGGQVQVIEADCLV